MARQCSPPSLSTARAPGSQYPWSIPRRSSAVDVRPSSSTSIACREPSGASMVTGMARAATALLDAAGTDGTRSEDEGEEESGDHEWHRVLLAQADFLFACSRFPRRFMMA